MAAAPKPVFAIGDVVMVYNKIATVRFYGEVGGAKGVYVGVEFSTAVGTSDGTFNGKRYFSCKDSHGMFVLPEGVKLQTAAQLAMRATAGGTDSNRSSAMPSPASSAPGTPVAGRSPRLSMSSVVRRASDRKQALWAADSPEYKAAKKIQLKWKEKWQKTKKSEALLMDTWNKLDQKEEFDLRASNAAYESLKAVHGEKTSKGRQPRMQLTPAREAAEAALTAQLATEGLVFPEPMTVDYVTALIDHFKKPTARPGDCNLLPISHVVSLITRARPLFAELDNVVRLNISTRLTIVGDIHGQLDDLLHIFKQNGLPSERNHYLFNGDFVDRGIYSCECILILLAYKILYPTSFHMNRGNHEARDINGRDGFEKECITKYNLEIFDMFSDLFACLPLAHLLNNKVFVVHAGLFWDDIDLATIEGLDRFQEIPPPDGYIEQMLWSDPDEDLEGRVASDRGASCRFGPDVSARFLAMTDVQLIVRSHECVDKGWRTNHDGKIVTVFSASNYCGSVGNQGAYIIFDKGGVDQCKYEPVAYRAQPKEKLTRYRVRHALMANDVIAKLIQRISDSRVALLQYWMSQEKPHAKGIISRAVWAEGLSKVLNLKIPFIEFQEYLGLPKLGTKGVENGDIDFQDFLLRFRPALPNKDQQKIINSGAAKMMENWQSMLSKNRFELESLFRHFDLDGDGMVSLAEFREGIRSLQTQLGDLYTDAEIDSLLLATLPKDHKPDQPISYEEFFSSFRFVDPKLASVQQAYQERKELLRPTTGRPGSGRAALAAAAKQ